MTKGRNKIHAVTKCALFSALICAVSPFVIPIGPIPLSLSLFAVMLTGAILPSGMALTSVLVYILAGAVGVPVFSGFRGGLSCLFGPTGGYIWSYAAVAVTVAYCKNHRAGIRLLLAFASLAICYVTGTVQYVLITGTKNPAAALALCVLPFVPFDIFKTIAAIALGSRIRTVLKKQNLI